MSEALEQLSESDEHLQWVLDQHSRSINNAGRFCDVCAGRMPCDVASLAASGLHRSAQLADRDARIAALEAERAAAGTALLEILRESCWEWRLTEWRKHSVAAVGTQPTSQDACREIREIARLALHDIGSEAEQ